MRTLVPLVLLGLAGCASSGAPTPEASAAGAPLDHHPGRRTRSPDGWAVAYVREGGELAIAVGDAPPRHVDDAVDPRVGFGGEVLYYAKEGLAGETDLWRVRLDGSAPERVTEWVGSEDRPVVSPDGARLAFVSGRSGVASWWVVRVDGALPVSEGTQLTNRALGPRRPGLAPTGFEPPPDGTIYAWTIEPPAWADRGALLRRDNAPEGAQKSPGPEGAHQGGMLTWSAGGTLHTIPVPP